MHTRADAAVRRQEDAFDRYVADRVGGADPADQLRTLGQLHGAGALTDAEFEAERSQAGRPDQGGNPSRSAVHLPFTIR